MTVCMSDLAWLWPSDLAVKDSGSNYQFPKPPSYILNCFPYQVDEMCFVSLNTATFHCPPS